ALGGGLVDVHLPGGYLEGAVVEVRLEGVDRALPEQVGVVVVEGPGEQLHVQRPLGGVVGGLEALVQQAQAEQDRKSTRLNSSHVSISYAVSCLKKKKIEVK